MADNLMVYSVVLDSAEAISTLLSELDVVIEKFTQIDSELENQWEGAAEKVYREKADTILPRLTEMRDLLEKYQEVLQNEVEKRKAKDLQDAVIVGGSLLIKGLFGLF